MAKKSADFNMSEEIRNLLRENRTLSLSEAFDALSKKHKLNKNSFGVAFYSARNKLGIKSGRRRKGGAKRTVSRRVPAAPRLDMGALQAAAKFVSDIGGADKAIAAVKQVASLQIK